MLIEKLLISDHPAIGTVELDFRDDAGTPARTVVLAGENGCGKTVVLEEIQRMFEPVSDSLVRTNITLVLDDEEARRATELLRPHFLNAPPEPIRRLHVTRGHRSSLSVVFPEISGGTPFGIDNSSAVGFGLRAVFRPANVIYPGNDLQQIGAETLDRTGLSSSRGGIEGNTLPQLLVSLEAQDASAIARYARLNPNVSPIGAVPSLLDRFRHAYGLIFPTKRLKEIRPENGRFVIVFEENGVETSIHQLSTGEKQVVFRAGFFIRDARVLSSAVVLIDEPELSLSPDWQGKIIDFYTHVLSDAAGNHPQIICATHSPFIVHSASAGKVIVLERGADGRASTMQEPVFPVVSPAIAVRAFNLDRFIREVQPGRLVVITEGVTDAIILETAWTKLNPGQSMPFKVEAGNGASTLQGFLNGPGLSALAETGKVVGLFDYDDEGFKRWSGVWKDCGTEVSEDAGAGRLRRHERLQAWAMLLPVPIFRSDIAGPDFEIGQRLSIELMFDDAAIPEGMKIRKKQVGGAIITLFQGSKNVFAELTETFLPEDFEAFRPLFTRVRAILAGTV